MTAGRAGSFRGGLTWAQGEVALER